MLLNQEEFTTLNQIDKTSKTMLSLVHLLGQFHHLIGYYQLSKACPCGI